MKNNIPVNTGKVRIGIYYEPPMQQPSEEEIYWQTVLLRDAPPAEPAFSFVEVMGIIFASYTALALIYYILN